MCNSGTAEIFNLAEDGRLKRRLRLNYWTRGFAWSDGYYFVGESADRKNLTTRACAHFTIINRKNWQVCDRFAVPGTEITFLFLVPKLGLPLYEGALAQILARSQLRQSQSTGTEPLHLLSLSEPLPREAFKIRVRAELPGEVVAGSKFCVEVNVENLGSGILASTAPCPVHVTYRWFKLTGESEVEQPEEGLRTRLPRPLPPRYSMEWPMALLAPTEPGSYRLQISLIQEWIMRFDCADAGNAFSASVEVRQQAAAFTGD